MAWDDDYFIPEGWSSDEEHFYNGLIDGDATIGADEHLQELFDRALFDHIHGGGGPEHDHNLQELMEYLDREYGIDFDENFDWEGWREWYEG